jgi:eukaryotic-like serine/threonine-protein kinase
MPADLHKAREHFLHAVGKLPPEQWDGYVESCGADAELQQQVKDLLQVHREAGSFLERPAADLGATGDFMSAGATESAPLSFHERVGTIIGSYKLLQQIGEGGMGTVFMAEQTQPVQRKVALKVIKPGMDSQQVIARFEAERQALAIMDHVNIARVFDGGTTENGRPYFVMELVHGVPITKYCDDNHLTPRERLELFVPVCHAIQHAHQKGIIHRDIKPSNVMITLYDGKPVPKVIDFGVAKATEQKLTERTLFTQYGTMVGTLEYMSPEQAETSALGVDTRSDIYSLGVLLYELLTGSTPLSHKRVKEAAYAEILRMIREEEPPKPSTRLSESGDSLASISAQRKTEPAKLSKQMRGELDWIVMKTLEKNRTRRYETANGVAADVQRYLDDEPVHACPPTAGYRFRKFTRRNKRVLAMVGLLILALVAGTAVSAWQAIRATDAEGLAQVRLQAETDAQNATRIQLGLTEAAQQKATRGLFDARLSQAKAGRNSLQQGQRYDSLKAIEDAVQIAREMNLPKERIDELRNEAIACMAVPDMRLGTGWASAAPETASLVFDGDYRRYAWANERGLIEVRRVDGDRQIATLEGFNWPGQPLFFSPDGHFIAAYSGDGRMQVWNIEGNKAFFPEPTSGVLWDFSPNSRYLAIGRPDNSISIYDLSSGDEIKRLQGGSALSLIGFDPSGERLAVCYQENTVAVQIWNVASGAVLTDLFVPKIHIHTLTWHPDGERVAFGYSVPANRVEIWNVVDRRQVATIEGHGQEVTGVSFHPDGNLLATLSFDGTVRLWNASTGKQLLLLTYQFQVKFSKDGNRLGFFRNGSEVQFVEVAAAHEYHTVVSRQGTGQGNYNGAAIGPDGRLLAVGMDDGVHLWDLATGRERDSLPVGGSDTPCFRAAGDELLTIHASGIRRWPLRQRVEEPDLLRIGPPQNVSLPFGLTRATCSPDCRTIAIASEQSHRGLVVDLPGGSVRSSVTNPDTCWIALSADGRWAASSGWRSNSVVIWDARTGMDAKQLELGRATNIFFTPDSRTLVTCRHDEYCFWDVETMQLGRRLRREKTPYQGVLAFSRDGKVLAVELSTGIIDLVNAQSGKTLARLEDPNRDRPTWMGFTPDGTRLVTIANYSKAIHIWDLRTIGMQLASMHLDWDLPAYPAASPVERPPLRVAVDLGLSIPETPGDSVAKYTAVLAVAPLSPEAYLRRGQAYFQLQKWREGADDLSTALALIPGNNDSQLWFEMGRCYSQSGQPKEALAAYSRSLELNPKGTGAWNNRGILHEQFGELDKAVTDFTRCIDLYPNSQNLNNRARTYTKLGQWEKAAADYTRLIELNKDFTQTAQLLLARSQAYVQAGLYREAIADDQRLLKLLPANAEALNTLAWHLTTCPDIKLRDSAQAIRLAQQALQLGEQVGMVWNTLGVAQYRAGESKEAIESLGKSMVLRNGGDAFDWFFLAMAHEKLGHRDEARKWYDRAMAWMDENKSKNEELGRFRAEAAALLKLASEKAPMPREKD